MTVSSLVRRDFWADRSVAVTGATGFLGRHVVAELRALDARVLEVVRAGGRTTAPGQLACSLLDVDALATGLRHQRCTTVVHLAGRSQVGEALAQPLETFRTNTAGTWSVLEAARVAGVEQVVLTSSERAYGQPATETLDEQVPADPVHPYDVSKAAADLVARAYASALGLPVGVARLSNLYGPGDRNWARIVPGTFRAVLTGEPPVLRSNSATTRDFLYVADAVEGLLLLVERLARPDSDASLLVNLAAGEQRTLLEMVTAVQRAAGTELAVNEQAEPGAAAHCPPVLVIDRARRELGWQPRTPLDRAMEASATWYRQELGSSAS